MRTFPFLTTGFALAVLLFASGCSDKKKWAEKQLTAREEAKSQLASDVAKPGKPTGPAKTDPYWDDAALIKITEEKGCPEGLWALFKGAAPGNTPAERKANEAKRAELVKTLKAARFTTRLYAPETVKVLDYDNRKAEQPLEVKGVIECTDSAGHIAIGFGDARATVPPTSVVQEGAPVVQNIWASAPLPFALPIKTGAEARAFHNDHKFDVDARIVYRLASTDVDRKAFKQPKVKEGEIEIGGGTEDWGAGRLVRTEIEAIRIATDHENQVLIDTRDKK